MTLAGAKSSAIRVVVGSVLVAGCARHPVAFEPGPPRGHFMTRPGTPGIVVAAPHGTTDMLTGEIASAIARRTGFGLVVATGFLLAEYERHVREVAGGRLRFYVEIHGNARQETAGRIEIATVGVDQGHALQLRTLLELTRDAHLRARPGAPKLDVRVEPLDAVFSTATGAKSEGMLTIPERALRIELPRTARHDYRELYTAILAEFIAGAAVLRPLR